MNAFGMSTIVKYLCYSASMVHVSSTGSLATVGALESSLEIKSLCLLPPATVLTLMVPYLFSFSNIWDSSVYFFFSCDMFFQCSERKMSLMSSCFISECIAFLPFLSHLLRPVLSDSCVMMAPTTSGSFLVIN